MWKVRANKTDTQIFRYLKLVIYSLDLDLGWVDVDDIGNEYYV